MNFLIRAKCRLGIPRSAKDLLRAIQQANSLRRAGLTRGAFFLAAVCVILTSRLAPGFDSAPVLASLKGPSSVIRTNAKTGSFLGSISVNSAIAVGCDGTTIAVLSSSGSVNRYDAQTGSFQGTITVGGKAVGVQVTGGVIVVQMERSLNRYNAKTGSFLGSTSL